MVLSSGKASSGNKVIPAPAATILRNVSKLVALKRSSSFAPAAKQKPNA
ncbi:Uncharacterised protein [Vibrio cholerae]|nr:Uncharacterised protein [Vibrio cholerae]